MGLPTNPEIAADLELLGDLLELDGAVRHRVLAYRRGAARVRSTGASVAELAMAGKAIELPDIGKTLQDKIVERTTTGTMAALERAKEAVPEGLVGIARLPGLGPKRALAIWKELGATTVSEVADLAREGRLREASGIGAGLERAVVEAIDAPPETDDRIPLGRALPVAEDIVQALRATGARAELAGSLRRGRETCHDLDIVVATERPAEIVEALRAHPAIAGDVSHSHVRAGAATHVGVPLEVLMGPPPRFGNLWQHASGSRGHNVRLRELAVGRGLSLSEHGIDGPDGHAEHPTEEGVYAALDLAWIPPELREDLGEIDLAAQGRLPDLIEAADVRGDLHAHTDWSDGADTIEAMADAAVARGYEYLAISDHSGSLAMAGGLDPGRVREQWLAIGRAQESVGVRLLRATEVDILADGALDHPDDLLMELDWVTASVHSSFRASKERMTRRLVAAIENPLVDAIGHPTGRMLGRRPHAEVDVPAVVAAAARTGTALEINGQPRRLDLDDRMAREALAAGVRLVIGSDAHATSSLDFMRYGVLVARRAGATRADIANCLPWKELAASRPRER